MQRRDQIWSSRLSVSLNPLHPCPPVLPLRNLLSSLSIHLIMGKFNLPFPIYCTRCQLVYSRNTLFEEAKYSIICKRCQEVFLLLASKNWKDYEVYLSAIKLIDLQWYLRAISQLQEADEQIEEDIEEDGGDEEHEVVQEGDANEEEGVVEEEDANEEEPGVVVVEEVDCNEDEGVIEEEYANEIL